MSFVVTLKVTQDKVIIVHFDLNIMAFLFSQSFCSSDMRNLGQSAADKLDHVKNIDLFSLLLPAK